MCKSSIYFGTVFLFLLTIVKTETDLSACEQKEKHQALLDLAKESINKAKDLHPTCDDDENSVSTNSCECGAKNKVSAYLEVAKNLIEEAKGIKKDSTCGHKRPVDCSEVLENGEEKSGVYKIWPRNRVMDGRSVKVYCDMDTDGGGWTVIQRRIEMLNKTDFYQDWNNYKRGFGNIRKEYWIGNDVIFSLTNQEQYDLRFDMQNMNRESRYAMYFPFWIEGENAAYTMHIGDYFGTAGDGFREADNIKFSTKDKRNDVAEHVCTEQKRGGWWYKDCSYSNPNGVLLPGVKDDKKVVNWFPWTQYDSLLTMEMKIRSVK